MIALRGILRKREKEATTTRLKQEKEDDGGVVVAAATATAQESSYSSAATATAASSMISRKETLVLEWTWEGVWAFGTLPEDILEQVQAGTPTVKCKHFQYTWRERRRAGDHAVPSLWTEQQDGDDENDKNNNEKTEEEKAGNDNNEDNAEEEEEENKTEESQKQDMVDEDKTREEHLLDSAKKQKQQQTEHEKQEKEVTSKAVSMDVDGGGVGGEETDDAAMQEQKDDDQTSKSQENKEQQSEANTPLVDIESGEGNPKEEEKANETDDSEPKINEKEVEQEGSSKPESKQDKQSGSTKTKSLPPGTITFATTLPEEPSYTEAATMHPEKCPQDGAWTGYFENAVKRWTTRIQEKFCLFFNATPSREARTMFPDDTTATDAPNATLKEGFLHVRGVGSNQFGHFELLGYYNPESGIMECQRMYVASPEEASSSSSSPSRGNKSTHKRDSSLVTPRPHHTRKRQMSWRKRQSLDDQDEMERIRKMNNSRKRARTLPSAADATASSSMPAMAPATSPSLEDSDDVAMTPVVVVEAPKRPLSRGAHASSTGQRKVSSQTKSTPTTTSSSGATTSTTNVLKLPSAGDPDDARWRAAHFLYYQRNDPEDDKGASTASFVVYEGEMLNGIRDGRGVCLYNNGTLYEGEWRRNREHGFGKLMSSDRKRIVYEGSWERGKMHGKGVYYYHDLYGSSKGAQSRYEGEWRENARHGVGTYYLPDNSNYEGEWSNNVMNGRGTFCWPDGSTFVGMWKDGKRHGQGVLRASDGFTYDGLWENNAMEGRGSATYPNGQRYNGLFSAGRREGRGTIHFTNGAIFEGRFRDDCMDAGTMKITKNVIVARKSDDETESDDNSAEQTGQDKKQDDKDSSALSRTMHDWMIPISFQSDMGHIHRKAGFTVEGG